MVSGMEAGQLEERAQHAQHLPAGPRVALRLHDRVERLRAAFHVDEGAGGLGEGRDRQHHMRRFRRRIAVGREHHAEFGIPQRLQRGGAHVQVRFQPHREIAAPRLLDHGARIERARLRHGAGEVCAHGVGAVGKHADLGARDAADLLRDGVEDREIGMLLRVVAEEDGAALLADQCRGDGFLHVADGAADVATHALAGGLRHGGSDRGELTREAIRARDAARRDGHQQLVVGDVHREKPSCPSSPPGEGARRAAAAPCAAWNPR
jgi:hypothetical protein